MTTTEYTEPVSTPETPADVTTALITAAAMSQPTAPAPALPGASPAPRPTPPQTPYVYAHGQIEPIFLRLGDEKESMQAAGQMDTAGLTDHQTMRKVLMDKGNLYLVRRMGWVLNIAGLQTCILVPKYQEDFIQLAETLREEPETDAIDTVVGVLAGMSQPQMYNGLMLPIVAFDKIYTYNRSALLKALAGQKSEKGFMASASELLDRVLSVSRGFTPEERAMNYAVVKYQGVYHCAADCHSRGLSLTSMDARRWRMSTTRNIVEVVLGFTPRGDGLTEKYVYRVDVEDEYPFLVSPITRFFDSSI